ncbi:MAG TPA: polymer-forming cytoskeletal protein [Pyrinomonadaceae bacterium]|nr:polymer-forming cytoskeletal protein [Pyrinomonadaceae bacterium]
MGRGNRPEEQSNDYNTQPQTPAAGSGYNYATEPPTPANRAISESDAMARDIKEGRLSGFVGHGTTLTGETEFHAMLRVDGHLIGTVSSESGTLIIGTNGQVDANVAVAAAMVNGAVNGDIVATEKLQLGRTARVMGNIQSPRLIIEEGAILEGSCSMLRARETQEEEAVAAATQYSEPDATESSDEDDAVGETESTQAYLLPDDEEEDEKLTDAAAV